MRETMAEHGPTTELVRLGSLSELDLPTHGVVIADAALPASLLRGLDDPLLVEAGEGLKSLSAVEALAEAVLQRRSSRPLTLVAVGGGSLGDAVGFLASVLWRGVELWHVPTTLLAMVDSAHGGKTAVNLGPFKNQLGTFHAASRVVLVDEAVATLPFAQREQGLAELIKALWLGDADCLGLLDAEGGVDELACAPFDVVGARLMLLLDRAIRVKAEIVAADPRETRGIRTVLNLGHSLAHGLELTAGLSHGHAVAWGMAAAAFASTRHGELSRADRERWLSQLYPLLAPLHVDALPDVDALTRLLARDKKRQGDTLRSVILDGPGRPRVITTMSAADWHRALGQALAFWRGPAEISVQRPHAALIELDASKSELNRLLVIRHLRPGPTEIVGESEADDVVRLRRGLEELRACEGSAASVHLEAGEGGTTLRFLLAVAARRSAETFVACHPRLLARPHGPLIDALRAGGAEITRCEEPPGFLVRGWPTSPARLRIDASASSQYASAIALLAASGEALELELVAEVASEPYLAMTLAMLELAGVEVCREGETIALRPTQRLRDPIELTAEADASSAAVWAVARHLGLEVVVENPALSQRQPDQRVEAMLRALSETPAGEEIALNLGECPDLAPVLTVAAALSPMGLRITGAAHLRHKESNRIEALASALDGVGISVEPTEDGLRVPAEAQAPTAGAMLRTHGDHRLAMVGLLLALSGVAVVVEEPWVVMKSYPALWRHARQAGVAVRPVFGGGRGRGRAPLNDSGGRSPDT